MLFLGDCRDDACLHHTRRADNRLVHVWRGQRIGLVEIMNRETPRQQNQRERLRQRLREIKPEDADMIELVGVLKGLLDIVDDMAIRGAR